MAFAPGATLLALHCRNPRCVPVPQRYVCLSRQRVEKSLNRWRPLQAKTMPLSRPPTAEPCVGIFFFAGQAIEVGGENWLFPSDLTSHPLLQQSQPSESQLQAMVRRSRHAFLPAAVGWWNTFFTM